jgi:hypothetical protein
MFIFYRVSGKVIVVFVSQMAELTCKGDLNVTENFSQHSFTNATINLKAFVEPRRKQLKI